MDISITKELASLIPGFKIGVIFYNNIEVGESPQMVKGRLQLFQESIYFDLLEKKSKTFHRFKNGAKFSRVSARIRTATDILPKHFIDEFISRTICSQSTAALI